MKRTTLIFTLLIAHFLVACTSPMLTPTQTPLPSLTAIPTSASDLPTLSCTSPQLMFVHVPAYSSFDDLQGKVTCVDLASYKVAVYIFVSGWWTKPLWDTPAVSIQSDGSWSADITTGGVDQQATKIAAFLVPSDFSPPLLRGEQVLPAELYANALAYVTVDREPVFRTIEFSGYTWRVKESSSPAGPGPNYFSDREEDVWVDAEGRLHLKIVQRDGRWYCTEVITTVPLGYGKYVFTVAGPANKLKNVVLGLFTWDEAAPLFNYREIDIELFSTWGEEAGQNSQFVVQPWTHDGNRYRFDATFSGEYSTHSFEWSPTSIQFSSSDAGAEIQSWSYAGPDIPPAGDGNARINLWLLNGTPPSDGQEVEVIIKSFEFAPQTKQRNSNSFF